MPLLRAAAIMTGRGGLSLLSAGRPGRAGVDVGKLGDRCPGDGGGEEKGDVGDEHGRFQWEARHSTSSTRWADQGAVSCRWRQKPSAGLAGTVSLGSSNVRRCDLGDLISVTVSLLGAAGAELVNKAKARIEAEITAFMPELLLAG
jgi:hypothetical protein